MDGRTQDLKNKVEGYIKSRLPLVGTNYSLDIENISFSEPKEASDIGAQMMMKYNSSGDVKGYLRGRFVVRKNSDGEVATTPRIMTIAPLYVPTDRGTYIVNGNEKSIETQMRRKPGAYTTRNQSSAEITTELIFASTPGSKYFPKITMSFDPNKSKFTVEIKGRPTTNFDGVNFLREMGIPDTEIIKAMGGDDLAELIIRSSKATKDVGDIYKAITGLNSSDTPDKTRALLYQYMSDTSSFGTGSSAMKNTIGVQSQSLTQQVILASVKRLFEVTHGSEEDNPDDLRFKDVLAPNDLMLEKIQSDYIEFEKRILPSLNDTKPLSLKTLSPAGTLGKSVDEFISKSEIVKSTEETNPLFMASVNQAVTQLGSNDGGITVSPNTKVSIRDVKDMAFGRIDPIETPESSTIGISERLAQSAKVRNGTIYAPFLKVFGRDVQNTDANTVELSPQEEFDAKVAYFDAKYVERKGDTLRFKRNTVSARHKGKNVMLPVSEIQYVDKNPQNLFNFSANMVPYVNHNDGNRALMGTNMQRHAINITGKQAPLVTPSVNGTNQTYDEFIGERDGKPVRSKAAGKVTRITESKIVVTDDNGGKHDHPYYKHFPLNQTYLNNELVVKVGDIVTKGQLLAEGWQTKGGKLALGLNANVGYLSYKGYNYEDGVVISDTMAEAMSSQNTTDYSVLIKETAMGGQGSGVKEELKKYTTNAGLLGKLDADGIVKQGTTVNPGDTLAAILVPEAVRDDTMEAALAALAGKGGRYVLKQLGIPATSRVSGKIERIVVVPKSDGTSRQEIIFTITSTSPMKVGDKLSGRHGNKGTVSRILPAAEMPYREDGVKLDILFSPAAVPSRKNPGQILELGSGLIATKTGERIVVDNFDPREKDKVKKGLRDIGIPDGKMTVFVPEDTDNGLKAIPTENKVTVGNAYIMRLDSTVDKAMQGRSSMETGVENASYMPQKEVGNPIGEKHNPQSVGEMEFRALEAQGAAWNILEASTVKADGGGDRRKRMAIFNALAGKNSDAMEYDVTPETMNLTANTLKGFGLKLQPMNDGKPVKGFNKAYDSMELIQMKPSEMLKTIGKGREVNTYQQFFVNKDNIDSPDEGGLFDPKIFGEPFSEESRKNWGYIKLPTPIPNPLLMSKSSYNPYAILTGMSSTDASKLLSNKKSDATVLIIDQKANGEDYTQNMLRAGLKVGDIVSAKKLEDLIDEFGEIRWKAGGEGMQYLLDKIDVKSELKTVKKQLDGAQDPKEVDALFKKYKTLNMLSKNKMEASDLMMQFVPVLPTYLRPNIKAGNDYVVSDINKLYQNLLKSTTSMNEQDIDGFNMADEMNPTDAARDTSAIYSRVSQVMGMEQGIDPKSKKNLMGLKSRLTSDNGIIRGKLLSKRNDFSARTVIGVDPNLSLDQVGLPVDTAKYIYKPFIVKELIRSGSARDSMDAEKKWEALDKDTRKAMDKIVADRPVLLNRQPTLHGLGIQAFKPVLKEFQDGGPVRNIQLNPGIVTAFNADFDGDQMVAHVPLGTKAVEEAKKLLMPSANLINPLNGRVQAEIRHEMALGIYHLTMDADKPVGEPKTYTSYHALRKDYKEGNVTSRTAVNVAGLSKVTAGYAMFILLLPAQFRSSSYHSVNKPWSAKDINVVLKKMSDICEDTGGKEISKSDIVKTYDNIKDLGFEASTRSGLSIGLNDLDIIDAKAVDNMYDAAKNKNPFMGDEKKSDIGAGFEVSKQLETGLKNNTLIDRNNPVSIMIASGARGNPTQFAKMMGTVGVGMSVTNKIQAPVKNSFVDGLSAKEYFEHSKDSRKGMFDRSVSSFVPGALSRDMWSMAQHLSIKERDCGTSDSVKMAKGSSSLRGRVVTRNIVLGDGKVILKKGEVITDDVLQRANADDTITDIFVRSPTKCKVVRGICQRCYGWTPGKNSFPKLGTAVGTMASQAFGETFTQNTLNTFHSGGISSNTTGLPKIKSLMNLSSNPKNKAVLATTSGNVTSISIGSKGTYDTIDISGVKHIIPHVSGESIKIKVSVGDKVTKGDFLTFGDTDDLKKGLTTGMTDAVVGDLFSAKKDVMGQAAALDYTRDYLSSSLNQAVQGSVGDKIDSRHTEIMVRELTSSVKVIDPGDSSFIKGSTIEKNVADKWNEDNAARNMGATVYLSDEARAINKILANPVKDLKGNTYAKEGETLTRELLATLKAANIREVKVRPRPVVYDVNLKSMIQSHKSPTQGSFFSNMGGSNAMEQIVRGVTFGETERFNDSRSRRMAGKLTNIGSGFGVARDIADNVALKFKNFFGGDKK